jgi:hypothetical protein
MPKKQQRLNFNEKQLEDGMTLSNYEIIDGSVIQLALCLVGGVGVIKKHLKKPEAVSELKARAVQHIKAFHVDMDETIVHDSFKAMVEDFQKSVNVMKVMHASGIDNSQSIMKGLTNDDLKHVKEVLSHGEGRRQGTEERIEKIIPIIFKKLAIIDHCEDVLISLQSWALRELCQLYADEYHVYNAAKGYASFDNTRFLYEVEHEIKARSRGVTIDSTPAPTGCIIN